MIVGGGIAGASLGARGRGQAPDTDRRGRRATAAIIRPGGRPPSAWRAMAGRMSAKLNAASRTFLTSPPRIFRSKDFSAGAARSAHHAATALPDAARRHARSRVVERAELERMVPGIRPRLAPGAVRTGLRRHRCRRASCRLFAAVPAKRRGSREQTRDCIRAKQRRRRMENRAAKMARPISAGVMVNAAGAWADVVAERLRRCTAGDRAEAPDDGPAASRPDRASRPAAGRRRDGHILFQGRGRQQRVAEPARRNPDRSLRCRARGNRHRDRDRPIRESGRLAGRAGRAKLGGPPELRAGPLAGLRLRLGRAELLLVRGAGRHSASRPPLRRRRWRRSLLLDEAPHESVARIDPTVFSPGRF